MHEKDKKCIQNFGSENINLGMEFDAVKLAQEKLCHIEGGEFTDGQGNRSAHIQNI